MSADPKRIIVTESCCDFRSVHTVLVYHQTFPELRIEGLSVEKAAGHLVNRLGASLDFSLDPWQREPVQLALSDAVAFLDREGYADPGHHVSGSH